MVANIPNQSPSAMEEFNEASQNYFSEMQTIEKTVITLQMLAKYCYSAKITTIETKDLEEYWTDSSVYTLYIMGEKDQGGRHMIHNILGQNCTPDCVDTSNFVFRLGV
jgi:hypothetical protein